MVFEVSTNIPTNWINKSCFIFVLPVAVLVIHCVLFRQFNELLLSVRFPTLTCLQLKLVRLLYHFEHLFHAQVSIADIECSEPATCLQVLPAAVLPARVPLNAAKI